jgi:hypothetical protein
MTQEDDGYKTMQLAALLYQGLQRDRGVAAEDDQFDGLSRSGA